MSKKRQLGSEFSAETLPVSLAIGLNKGRLFRVFTCHMFQRVTRTDRPKCRLQESATAHFVPFVKSVSRLVGKIEEKRPLEDPGVQGMTIFKLMQRMGIYHISPNIIRILFSNTAFYKRGICFIFGALKSKYG